eukprot:m.78272 g.78272  ORF g.78272 m.78272 type:complete len:420 (+) comp14578_c0_seq1:219-1478(+)
MAGEAGESERLISRQRPRSFVRNWIAFFLLGTVNNLTFVIINSAAKTIVRDYHKESLIGLIPWASVALSFVARGANTLLLDRATYAQRIIANAVLMVVGLLGVAFANSFWLSLVAILISGASSSFGESCTLGYLRLYPSTLVNAWSSGTGMAGVGGSALYLLYSFANLSLRDSFLYTLPWVAVYLISFFVILDRSGDQVAANEPRAARDLQVQEAEETHKDIENWKRRLMRCIRLSGNISLQLLLVYFFEYVISAGCAAKVFTPLRDCHFKVKECTLYDHCTVSGDSCVPKNSLDRNTYAILAFCYQFGVLISRSSLQLVKFPKVWFMTALQCMNFVLWMCQDQFKMMDVWELFPLMVFVGLLGGAMYVNVFYLLLHDPRIPTKDRELCINLAAFAITIGITLASAFVVLIDSTAFKDK